MARHHDRRTFSRGDANCQPDMYHKGPNAVRPYKSCPPPALPGSPGKQNTCRACVRRAQRITPSRAHEAK